MKTKSLLGALLLFVTSVLVAAPSRSILVLGTNSRIENGKTIYTGSVSLIFKDPSETIKVSADEIVFDQGGGVSLLRCSGETVIESGGRTTKGKDLTYEFADMSGNIYVLNRNGIVMGSSTVIDAGGFRVPPAPTQPSGATLKFESQQILWGGKPLPSNILLYGRNTDFSLPK